ncbi:HNH endonuclease [Escherichia coli]|nr:HNH endonuclease [Escherichia coli]
MAELVRGGLDSTTRRSLERMIAEARGEDPIASRVAEYEASPSLNALYNLIDLLEARESWPMAARYAEDLVRQVPAAQSAAKFAKALYELGEMGRIHSLLSSYPEFVAQSEYLKSLWCICLFERGELRASSDVLSDLRRVNDRSEYREMLVRLAVASGEWDSLATFVDSEWNAKDNRSAADLLRAAQLAQAVQPSRAREFAREAVSKAKANVEVLIAAYTIATHGGWEDEGEAGEWLRQAIERSSESGPIQKMSLGDLIDRTPAWNKREDDTWKSLRQGEVPVFGAALMINRTLCDLFLLPALANSRQPDPRKRTHIFAYSGAVRRVALRPSRIALDATALLTLGILRLAEAIIETSAEIIVPHTTLGWLFEEKQRIRFHQPSRVEAAADIRSLIHSGKLDHFLPTQSPDPELANEVGAELAALLAEASAGVSDIGKQKLVVRSNPVHKVGSLMDENADLGAYSTHLCSCQTVIEKLRETGHLTEGQFRKAQTYLASSEQKWPNEPQIQDGAELYLDGLAVNYLQRVGVLPKLKQAGFRAIVSKFETAETSSLLAYSALARDAEDTIEYLRASLATGIRSGKVRVGPLPREGRSGLDDFRTHPTVSILDVAALADAVVVDDRFVNQHGLVSSGDRSVPIITSFELLDDLLAGGHLANGDYLDQRTLLRMGGYLFAGVNQGELEEHLANSIVKEGSLVEGADLKAIRENVQQSRMAISLILPKESVWLVDLQRTVADVLRAQWSDVADLNLAAARSDWLLALLDVRGWAESMGFEAGQSIAQDSYMSLVFATMRPPTAANKGVVSAYWEWLEAAVIEPLRTTDPSKFEALVKQAHGAIIHVMESNEVRDGDGDE